MVTASNLHNKVKWNRWDNGVVLIDISAPEALTDDKPLKAWMQYFNDQMKNKITELNAEVAEMEKSR